MTRTEANVSDPTQDLEAFTYGQKTHFIGSMDAEMAETLSLSSVFSERSTPVDTPEIDRLSLVSLL